MNLSNDKQTSFPNVGEPCSREQAFALAVFEAQKGAGRVAPNPLVGCVVVSPNGKLLASGHHAQWGKAHAEVAALDKITLQERAGATVYVTLEPCSHQGKTPPCADRLIKDKVANVFVGVLDPNPLVAGKGIEKLKAAGIQVEFDNGFTKSSERVAEQFLWNMKHKQPFVTLKLAMSLDGKIALRSGESQWLTSPESRFFARCLRAYSDSTLIGAGTLIHDDPKLDFRDTEFAETKKNKILIWDPKEKVENFLPKSQLLKTHGAGNIETFSEISEEQLKGFYEKGITSLFVEGGGKTLSQFIEKKLFNKIIVFIAPVLLGRGKEWAFMELESMSLRTNLEFADQYSVGTDRVIVAYPKLS